MPTELCITYPEMQVFIHTRSTKSCGHDDLLVRTLKLSKYLPAPLLSYVINESICDGVFPNNLKIAKVVPIFKSGDSEIPTNYRPISVLIYF